MIRKLTKTSELCPECYSLLTEDKSIEIEDLDYNFSLIQLLDRGGLKWPSKQVLNSVFTTWKVLQRFSTIGFKINFSAANSLKLDSEEFEDLDYECFDCCTEGKALFHSLLTTVANCLLNNKVKNLNIPTTCSKDNQRKYLKLSSE